MKSKKKTTQVGYVEPETLKIIYINVANHGYPEFTGRILKQRYNTLERVKTLVDNGDIRMMNIEHSLIIFFKDLEEYLGPSYKEDFCYDEKDLYFTSQYNYLFDYRINDWLYKNKDGEFKILE